MKPTKEQIEDFASNILLDDEIRIHISTFNVEDVHAEGKYIHVENIEFIFDAKETHFVYSFDLVVRSYYGRAMKEIDGYRKELLDREVEINNLNIHDYESGEDICLTSGQVQMMRKLFLEKLNIL